MGLKLSIYIYIYPCRIMGPQGSPACLTLLKVKDGLSQVMKNMAKLFLLDSCSFATGVRIHNAPGILRASLKVIISDEAGLKFMFQNKGASGSKPCFRCRNVVPCLKSQQVFLSVPCCLVHFLVCARISYVTLLKVPTRGP